ncbi:uncharacterized protein MONOS_14452 [Monocercomonoides exilis]|uniref:uncharacterized protein n=1 Tax=Monocercomonoides exilis TaxID=2049356 RepID=UPI0035595A6E|nr:hypothetical protein MONOS_14452 [Monocercomonoides exilis]|eukprot:MONOS_14452.1-p1 / transcript=MONOS_14452.1 / gene=MONOS_14452 / organism=Monocercomonoides_exilis_PA203 / gene_product=unspecified product / transcript_product=unspecified product / location=Mono_scaffold01004:18424-18665(+) / protein_length=57 / sequence_SO=supercontig / SO=protein_coding / is_pseudo=false
MFFIFVIEHLCETVPQMKVEFNFTIHFIINIILTLLAYLPGIIHAFLILFGVAQNWC